ncbi:unnamed protein product [Linum trigynum]|uniref:Uncharacterized protein n=1 Tax=Linum trigynum TaxID=586398 RepID=A0AAV2D6C8_9ROSI
MGGSRKRGRSWGFGGGITVIVRGRRKGLVLLLRRRWVARREQEIKGLVHRRVAGREEEIWSGLVRGITVFVRRWRRRKGLLLLLVRWRWMRLLEEELLELGSDEVELGGEVDAEFGVEVVDDGGHGGERAGGGGLGLGRREWRVWDISRSDIFF